MVPSGECRGQQIHPKVKGSVQEKLWETRRLAGAVGGRDKELDSGYCNDLVLRHRSLGWNELPIARGVQAEAFWRRSRGLCRLEQSSFRCIHLTHTEYLLCRAPRARWDPASS